MLQALHSQLQCTIEGAHGKRRGNQITERLHGLQVQQHSNKLHTAAMGCVASAALIRLI
jgi:hypothetical protein